MQDWMGTSVGGVNPVALDLSVTYKVSVLHCFWLDLSLAFTPAGSCCISPVVLFNPASYDVGFQLVSYSSTSL